MKKLYVSCPIEGRDWKDVCRSFEQMQKIAEVLFGEKELEIVNPPRVVELKDVRLEDLARHMMLMSEADYYIGVQWFSGPLNRYCLLENELANEHGLKTICFDVDLVPPDYKDVLRRLEEQEMKRAECSNTNCVSPRIG